MTKRTKKAIIDYWLWKHGLLRQAEALRRSMPRKAVRAAVLVFFLALSASGESFAAEAKLYSSEAIPAQAVKKEEAPAPVKKAPVKKKVELPSVSKEEAEAEGEIKSLKGKVSGVNNFGVALEYGEDPELGTRELWAEFMKETKVDGIKKFRELQMGDTVEVTYKELKKSSKRLLQKVRLVKRKPKELEAVEA